MDILDLDRRALAAAGDQVARVSADQLGAPTPCLDWTLRELLAHMVAHNHGFAAAARGQTVPAAVWDGGQVGDHPYPAYAESAQTASDAFAAPGALDRQIELPGLGAFPLRIAIGFHFVDYLIHGWDVARAIGVTSGPSAGAEGPDSELTATALKFASRWPDVPQLRGPGAPFGPKVGVPAGAPPFDRLLGLLGRSPDWTASAP
jgi:uncharacterized protein (TIGR03086 family)